MPISSQLSWILAQKWYPILVWNFKFVLMFIRMPSNCRYTGSLSPFEKFSRTLEAQTDLSFLREHGCSVSGWTAHLWEKERLCPGPPCETSWGLRCHYEEAPPIFPVWVVYLPYASGGFSSMSRCVRQAQKHTWGGDRVGMRLRTVP